MIGNEPCQTGFWRENNPVSVWQHKMAAKRGKQSLASELLDVIKKEAFTKIVCGLDNRRGTTVEAVKKKYASLMANHWVDTSVLLNSDGSPKATGIYEIFGRIANKSGYEVKEEVLDWMCDKCRELAANMSIAFGHKNLNIIAWMSDVEKDNYPADEFVIYSLCRLYDVHCILLTKHEPWSTISRQFSMSVEDVWAKSDLRLVMLWRNKKHKSTSKCSPTPIYQELNPTMYTNQTSPKSLRQTQNCKNYK